MKGHNTERMNLMIGLHTLGGIRNHDGTWGFCCSFPDLQKKYDGAQSAEGILTEFIRRALPQATIDFSSIEQSPTEGKHQ